MDDEGGGVVDASTEFGSPAGTRTGSLSVRCRSVRDLDNRLDGGPQRWYTATLSVRSNPLMNNQEFLRRYSPLLSARICLRPCKNVKFFVFNGFVLSNWYTWAVQMTLPVSRPQKGRLICQMADPIVAEIVHTIPVADRRECLCPHLAAGHEQRNRESSMKDRGWRRPENGGSDPRQAELPHHLLQRLFC